MMVGSSSSAGANLLSGTGSVSATGVNNFTNTGYNGNGSGSRKRKRTRSIHNMRIEMVVGSGTFGVVYKAVDKTDSDTEVALKKIKMERETQGFPVTALREIKILNMMRNHRNIVHLREIVTYEGDERDREPTVARQNFDVGDVFMVFEFVDYDLSGLLKSKAELLTKERIQSFTYQLLDGVRYMHGKNILHRDIKSANLLVTRNNVLKIADWGLARTVPKETVKLTNPVVTLWYRSPEVIIGSRQYGPAVDMWSVGCILGEMVHRTAIFRADKEAAQLEVIFRLMGTPQGATAARYEELEQWRNFAVHEKHYPSTFAGKFNQKLLTANGQNLLGNLLDIDFTSRATAEQALRHPYFERCKEPHELAVIDVAPVTEWMEQERQRKKHEQFLREREAREKMKADRCKELEYQKSGHNQQILFNTGQVNAGFRKMEAAEGAEIKEKFVIKKRSKNTVGAGAAAGVSAGAAAAGTVSSSSAEAGKGMSGNVGAAPDETPPPRPPAPP